MALEMFWQIAFEKMVPLSLPSAMPEQQLVAFSCLLRSICHNSRHRSQRMKPQGFRLLHLPVPTPLSPQLPAQRALSCLECAPCCVPFSVTVLCYNNLLRYWLRFCSHCNQDPSLPLQYGGQACSLPLLGFVLQGIVGPVGSIRGQGKGKQKMWGANLTVGAACQDSSSSCWGTRRWGPGGRW